MTPVENNFPPRGPKIVLGRRLLAHPICWAAGTVTQGDIHLSRKCYAHTLPGRPAQKWHDLLEHLEGVSERAAASGDCFQASAWARVAGLWHDLGKYSDAFQEYLKTASSPDPHIADSDNRAARTDHSTAGAQHAEENIDVLGHLLAYAIAGHHSGLLDGRGPGSCLEARLAKTVESWRSAAPASLVATQNLNPPPILSRTLWGVGMLSAWPSSCACCSRAWSTLITPNAS